MPNSIFEFFELICVELRSVQEFILTDRNLPQTLAAELKTATKRPSLDDALMVSYRALENHFRDKGSDLPFSVDFETGTLTPTDTGFISFVADAFSIRSSGEQSKAFEVAIGNRLAARLMTGSFYNVGWPRKTNTRLAEINGYLEGLGFDPNALRGRDKDGGLDVLWLPPLGTLPIRPLVSFQCKNSRFSEGSIREANSSVVSASRTIHRRTHMNSHGVYMCYVVFNDYLDSNIYDMAAGLQYAPLGLSDLSPIRQNPTMVIL